MVALALVDALAARCSEAKAKRFRDPLRDVKVDLLI